MLGFGVVPPASFIQLPGSHPCPRENRARHRLDQRHRPRHRDRARRPAAPTSCSTASATPTRSRTLRAEARRRSRRQGALRRRRPVASRTPIEAMMGNAIEEFGERRHPGQQRRHPVRRADRRVPGRQVERDPRAQPDRVVPHHPARGAEMKAKKWGRIVNIASAHALVASPYKAAYVAAKHGIAGLTKTVALEVADAGHHDERRSARATCGRRSSRSRSPTPRRPAGSPKTQVINDVLLHAQPTQEVRPGVGSRRADRLSRERRSRVDHRRDHPDRRRLDGAIGPSAMATTTKRPSRRAATARMAPRTTPDLAIGKPGHSRARSCSSCKAAARSVPTRSASTRRCTRPASSPTG